MLTFKLKIKTCSDNNLLSDYIYNYTGLFYKMYNNAELMVDGGFIKNSLNCFIDKSIYDFCKIDVETKLKQQETIYNKNIDAINEIKDELISNEFTTKLDKRRKYKLIKKLSYLNTNLDKGIVFGGKALLRKITKLSQSRSNDDLLYKYKEEFTKKRRLGIYLVGRAMDKGNRKVNFDFNNDTIVFKPNSKTKINIEYYCSKGQKNILTKLQVLSTEKLIPLTVRITDTHIMVTYDEEFLNGYSFNSKGCKEEQKLHICKELKKEIYIKWKNEQNERKLKGKLKYRYLSVDLNPKYIGISILDKDNSEEGFKVIHFEAVDLSMLSNKLRLSSNGNKQLKQSNKRKHEIREVWKYIFGLCKHYKVSSFVMEDLKFKTKTVNSNGKEFNRQTKNIWHRTLTTNLITKYCNQIGLDLIGVNPVYSSFIGNMVHNEFDPIASSIEIGRRGMYKYIKGFSIYPSINRINQEKLNYLLGENILIDGLSWKQLYTRLSVLRYRNPLNGLIDHNLFNVNSKLRLLN